LSAELTKTLHFTPSDVFFGDFAHWDVKHIKTNLFWKSFTISRRSEIFEDPSNRMYECCRKFMNSFEQNKEKSKTTL